MLSPDTISWTFLFVTSVGALFTWNAYFPARSLGPLNIASFFGGWLTSELSAHHFAWQLIATVIFVWAGALAEWPGQLGLGITLASWVGLLALIPLSRRADPVLESALQKALGPSYREQILPELQSSEADRPPAIRLQPIPFLDPQVRVHRDIPYVDGGTTRNQLDVYTPAKPVQNAPVLLQIHGGGWVIGNKHEQALPLMNHMTKRGWICVAANYRLSPKATFPDHLIDLKRALVWIHEHIAEFGGNPDFVAVTGGSAGGHLSSLLSLTADDPRYQPGFETANTAVRACVPFYGVYDFSNHHELHAQKGIELFLERMVLKQNLEENPQAFRDASPMHRIHAGAPPFFVIHGTHDSLASVEEGRHFATLLGETSTSPVAYAELPGAQHAFEIFHSLRTAHVVLAVERFLAWVYSDYLRRQA